MWILFYGEFLSLRCMKNESFRKGSVRICSTPKGPSWSYLSVKHLGWTGTKGGDAVRSPEVFSLAVECFQCGTLSVRSLKGKQLSQKQESATNNMATHGPCWSCCRLLRPADCCCLLPWENTQLTVCVFVWNNTLNQSAVEIWLCRCGLCILSHSFLITVSLSNAMFYLVTIFIRNELCCPFCKDR